jgi:hypothetical protein
VREIEQSLRSAGDRKSSALRGGFRELERVLEALVRRSEVAEDRLEALSLGAQASDYVWFRNRFPRARGFMGSDQWSVYWRSDPDETRFTREEVMRGLDFVTTVALHWQQFPSAPSPESDDEGTGPEV